MKLTLKLGLFVVIVGALLLSFGAASDIDAVNIGECPSAHCPQALDGYSYVGTCSSDIPGQTCLGWVYKKGSQTCHVPALGGL